jgi:hypothetical protein
MGWKRRETTYRGDRIGRGRMNERIKELVREGNVRRLIIAKKMVTNYWRFRLRPCGCRGGYCCYLACSCCSCCCDRLAYPH